MAEEDEALVLGKERLVIGAQRIDPELNPFDRSALSLAYYLKQRYDAAAEQAELNLRRTEGANFSRIVLADGRELVAWPFRESRRLTGRHYLNKRSNFVV